MTEIDLIYQLMKIAMNENLGYEVSKCALDYYEIEYENHTMSDCVYFALEDWDL